MKKEAWVSVLLVGMVVLMSLAVRGGGKFKESVTSIAVSKLTDPNLLMKNQIPI